MRGFCYVFLVGEITEVRPANEELPYGWFRLKVKKVVTDARDGTRSASTGYHLCIVRDKRARTLLTKFTIGVPVMVSGSLHYKNGLKTNGVDGYVEQSARGEAYILVRDISVAERYESDPIGDRFHMSSKLSSRFSSDDIGRADFDDEDDDVEGEIEENQRTQAAQ